MVFTHVKQLLSCIGKRAGCVASIWATKLKEAQAEVRWKWTYLSMSDFLPFCTLILISFDTVFFYWVPYIFLNPLLITVPAKGNCKRKLKYIKPAWSQNVI